MCNFNPKNESRRIDPCMINIIQIINKTEHTTLGCCCGHGKYPMTIIAKDKYGTIWELFSLKIIPRKKRFYKRDKQGVYYIPEVLENDTK